MSAKNFNRILFSLLDILRASITTTTEREKIDRLKTRINTTIMSGGEDFILRLSDRYFTEYSNDIINRNESIFLNFKCDASTDSEFVTLLNLIKKSYKNMKTAEKDIVYNKVKSLLESWANS